MNKRIAPAAIQALKEALTLVYWYKSDLRSFLSQCLSDSSVLSRLNWSDYKRNIVKTLVDHLTTREDTYQRDIIRLMSAVCQITDFSHLRKLEDGVSKAKDAEAAVTGLRVQLKGYQDLEEEARHAEDRRKKAHARLLRVSAVQRQLEEMKNEYFQLVGSEDSHQRGFLLEKIIKNLFNLFDLDAKASFKITGEQIDGAFSFEGTDYILEARWRNKPTIAQELDGLSGKLSRKLDNTLGLFLSINGFSDDAVKTHQSGKTFGDSDGRKRSDGRP